jgi:sugar/nucleoside kinase (ribokinase family)
MKHDIAIVCEVCIDPAFIGWIGWPRPGEKAYAVAREYKLPRPVIKLRCHGAVMQVDGPVFEATPPAVDVIDITGERNAFYACFADDLPDHPGCEDYVYRACVCRGLSTQKAGALGTLARRKELKEVYEITYFS